MQGHTGGRGRASGSGILAPRSTLQTVFDTGSWHNLGTFLGCSDEQMLKLCCFEGSAFQNKDVVFKGVIEFTRS